MQKYGLIGYPLGHSFSRNFFNQKFEAENIDAQYINFEIPTIKELKNVLKENHELHGLNVTIPYKEQVIPYLDDSLYHFKSHAMEAKNVEDVIRMAKDLNLFCIVDLLSCFSNDFDARCYGMNVERKRFMNHIRLLLQFLNANKQMRLKLLLGQREEVFNMFLSTAPDDPESAKNAMKAAISSAKLATVKQVKQMVTALVDGGCAGDAIDILILVGRYFDAVKLLIDQNDFETPVIILQTVLYEFETEDSIESIRKAMKSTKCDYQVVPFLMACGCYNEAYEELVKREEFVMASVVRALQEDRSFDGDLFETTLNEIS